MIVERIAHSGAWRISDIVNGYWFTRVYYGYSKRDAMREYREDRKHA
jgi:hypothetical protein